MMQHEHTAKGKTVFVTVGTTSFDELTQSTNNQEFLNALYSCGFHQIVMQIGNSSFMPSKSNLVEIDWYKFKPSIKDDIKNSDLVISHAGAGSILEALKAMKPLIVVANDKLMDNHQCELAKAFAEKNNLVYCDTRSLTSTIKENKFSNLTPFVNGRPEMFGAFMDEFMGV